MNDDELSRNRKDHKVGTLDESSTDGVGPELSGEMSKIWFMRSRGSLSSGRNVRLPTARATAISQCLRSPCHARIRPVHGLMFDLLNSPRRQVLLLSSLFFRGLPGAISQDGEQR